MLPDSKAIAITLLALGLPSDVLVSSKTPAGSTLTGARVVRVLRIGGTADMRGWGDPASRDRPRFSVDCYAPTEEAAMRLAQQVCSIWELLPGQVTDTGEVTGVSQETGPQDRPEEPNTGVARVGMTLGMSVRPPRISS
ncbi:hypothetical protein [Streptomyces bugieae]|uniref:Tail terminator n=1 Tax=Streptomyces bugieae TaxID=3098223 RepID=A0ABU7NKV9_9ACTN|nr:hypothetical protein [Streptomyces sp. DSM 41528]